MQFLSVRPLNQNLSESSRATTATIDDSTFIPMSPSRTMCTDISLAVTDTIQVSETNFESIRPAVEESEKIADSALIKKGLARPIRVEIGGYGGNGDGLSPETFHVIHGPRLALLMVGVLLGMVPAALDETIVVTSMYSIASEFNALAVASWLATTYLLTVTAFSPVYGKLSDIFGLRITLFAAMALFMAASVLCALAPSLTVLIIGRCILGAGGAGLLTLPLIIISKCVKEGQRGKLLGLTGMVHCISSVAGPIIGGAFTDQITWRGNFFFNLPICVVAFILVFFTLRVPTPQGSLWAKLKRVDYLGTIMFIVAASALMLSLEWGGKDYAWDSGVIVGLLVGGTLLVIIFLTYELRLVHEPMFDLTLLSYRNVWIACVVSLAVGWVLFTILYYIPLFHQVMHEDSTLIAGLSLLPFLLPLNIIIIGVGYFTERFKRYRAVVSLGMVLLAVGVGLFYLMSRTMSSALLGAMLGITGAGVGLCFEISLIPAQREVKADMLAQVTAIVNFARCTGGMLGVSVSGSAIHQVLANTVGKLEMPLPLSAIEMSLGKIFGLAPELNQGVMDGYVGGIRLALLITFVPVVLGLLVSFFSKRKVQSARP
ncbi:hypothetical protein H4R34_000734 [Dimargaris verticillata]|uniref:Major facilitator superfamily (MFS) profile domain-containing protein n=1 Tax=Dimargaris verticillata TaxID=2761393 RepID=A0A9W8EFM8_9FUNG|nr:hypothetical protein H4R34_000734 [Dimargaris verticillata]